MPERMIPCPWCGGYETACSACRGTGTTPDRRKPTANDRAVERINAYLDEMDPHPLSVHSRVLDIIREEAERHE